MQIFVRRLHAKICSLNYKIHNVDIQFNVEKTHTVRSTLNTMHDVAC